MSPVSTATETLQPNSRWVSDESPPKTTSTAPLYEYPAEEVMYSDLDLNTRIHETQFRQSSTPFQQSYLPHDLPANVQHNGAHLAAILDKVAALQDDVSVQRSHARNFRNTLRYKREQENQIRLSLQNNLDSIRPEDVHTEYLGINHTIENLQAATASYLGLEAEYQKVENALEQKEQDLDRHTALLTGILRKEAMLLAQEQYDIDFHSYLPVHHSRPAEDTHDLISPEIAGYTSLVEDARGLRTRLEEPTRDETEYMKIIDQQKVRGQNSLPLDNDAQLFLEQHEDRKSDIKEQFNATHLRLENYSVRKLPHEDTVAVTDDEWRDLLKKYLPDYSEDQPPDLLRASKLDDRSPFFETARPLPLNKSNFVNHWLLYRLRHSAIEILQFKSQPELVDLMDKGWDGNSISQMAMRLWYEDGTTKVETAE